VGKGEKLGRKRREERITGVVGSECKRVRERERVGWLEKKEERKHTIERGQTRGGRKGDYR